nr:glycosyltransferase family 61 protein [Glycomyces amatae]
MPLAGPLGWAASAVDWMAATGRGRLHLYEQPVVVDGAIPIVWGEEAGQAPPLYRRSCAPGAVVAELPEGTVIGPGGAVVTSDGCVLADQIAAVDRAPARHRVWRGSSRAPVHLPGTAAVVAATGGPGGPFGSFLTDTLPRLQLIRDAGIEPDHWIVSGAEQPWHREGLDAAGIDPDAVHLTRWDRPVRAERLIVPSRPGPGPVIAPWARQRLRRLLHAPDRRGTERLLLSSTAAPEHQLVNEPVLAALLADFGFTRVVLEHHHFAEQVKLIGQARCIVATRSAALTHLLHAPAGGTVVEIAPGTGGGPDIGAIAAVADWEHYIVPAAIADPPDDLDPAIEALAVAPGAVLGALAQTLPGIRMRPPRPAAGARLRHPAARRPEPTTAEGPARA